MGWVRLNLNRLTILEVDVIIGDVVHNVQVLTCIDTFAALLNLALRLVSLKRRIGGLRLVLILVVKLLGAHL